MRRSIIVSLLVFLSVTAFALESFGPSSVFSVDPNPPEVSERGFNYVQANAPKEGEIRLGSFGSFNNLNPFIISGVAADGLDHTYEPLGMQSYDALDTVYALIAESFALDNDHKTFTVRLRKHARFHDGTQVSSADIEASYTALIAHGHPAYQQLFTGILRVELPDPHTIIFHFDDHASRDLPFNIASLPVLSKHDLSEREFSKTTMRPLQGTGPYIIDKISPGHAVSYRLNPSYWGANLNINRGRHNFRLISYRYFRDQSIALTAFKAGRYDWRSENIAKFWARQYQGKSFTSGDIIKVEVPVETPVGMQAFAMNTRRAPFKDRRVREALNLAFDFDWLNNNLFYRSYQRSQSFFSHSEFAATSKLSAAEAALLTPYRSSLPDALWSGAEPISNASLTARLHTAQNLLDQAGWIVEGNHRRHLQSGKKLQFTLLINSPAMQRVALPYQQILERLGIAMKIQLISPSDWIARIKSSDFEMTTYSWPAPTNPGSEQFLFWHSSQAHQVGSLNIMGIDNPAVDSLVTQINVAKHKSDVTMQMRALDRILMWQYYVIPHWHLGYSRIAYWKSLCPPKTYPRYGVDLSSWYHIGDSSKTCLK